MKYTEEMILHSDSGYCMPFEEPQGKDVEMSLGYGEQVHPATGEKFFHHGIDFNVRCYMLSAVASGIVSGVGNDPVHGICQTVRYGGYEVTYGHLSNVFAQFGQRVKAGQTVALSGELLHIEVKFKGEELNPIEFLTMLYGNIKALQEADGNGAASFYDAETRIKRKQLFFDFKFKAKYLAFISCLLEKPDLSVKTALKSIFRKSQVRSISEKFGLNLNAQIVCLSPSQWVNCFLEMLEVVPEKFHPS